MWPSRAVSPVIPGTPGSCFPGRWWGRGELFFSSGACAGDENPSGGQAGEIVRDAPQVSRHSRVYTSYPG